MNTRIARFSRGRVATVRARAHALTLGRTTSACPGYFAACCSLSSFDEVFWLALCYGSRSPCLPWAALTVSQYLGLRRRSSYIGHRNHWNPLCGTEIGSGCDPRRVHASYLYVYSTLAPWLVISSTEQEERERNHRSAAPACLGLALEDASHRVIDFNRRKNVRIVSRARWQYRDYRYRRAAGADAAANLRCLARAICGLWHALM